MHKKIEEKLQLEAKEILNNKKLWKPFTDVGKIHPVGSFALNLLVYGDLDVYFEPKDQSVLIDAFANSMQNAAHLNEIKTIRFERDLDKREAKAAPGIYLQFKFDNKIRIWQIDIWSCDKEYQEKFFKEFEILKSKINPQNRDLILKIKHKLMKSKGKTPSFVSFYVYRAILEEGLSDINEIENYLKNQGIKLF